MEECRLVTLAAQQRGNAADVVHGGWRKEEGFDKHGDGRQDAGHPVNALAPVAIAVGEGGAPPDQRVYMGGQ